jgi:hypothetical protein
VIAVTPDASDYEPDWTSTSNTASNVAGDTVAMSTGYLIVYAKPMEVGFKRAASVMRRFAVAIAAIATIQPTRPAIYARPSSVLLRESQTRPRRPTVVRRQPRMRAEARKVGLRVCALGSSR